MDRRYALWLLAGAPGLPYAFMADPKTKTDPRLAEKAQQLFTRAPLRARANGRIYTVTNSHNLGNERLDLFIEREGVPRDRYSIILADHGVDGHWDVGFAVGPAVQEIMPGETAASILYRWPMSERSAAGLKYERGFQRQGVEAVTLLLKAEYF